MQTENPFERTIMLAISLGGDTDTVATMAGAMAGAYWGLEHIPHSWQVVCEPLGIQGALQQAETLYNMVNKT